MLNVKNEVKSFLQKYQIYSADDVYIVAFSGGYDSMCLLDVLKKLAPKNKIIAIHLNHNWRGEESDNEEVNCRDFCEKIGVEFYCEKLDDKCAKTETAGRDARYEFFKRCAEKFNSKIIFTAHNKNDNAETLLYRICKGTGVEGLRGISEMRDIFYRPLLSVSRVDVEKYCIENKLIPNNDSSNSDIKYKRNLIRVNIVPELEKVNENAVDMINSLSEIARAECEIISQYLEYIEAKITKDGKILTKKFLNLSDALKKRLIYKMFLDNNLDYDRKKIENILDFIIENSNSKSGKTCSLTKDLWIFASEENIEVVSELTGAKSSISIIKEGKYEFGEYLFEIEKFEKPVIKFPKDSDSIAYVDLSGFEFNFELRQRQDGDVISPFGLSGTQKLKKYFNSRKIPNHRKDFIPLFAQENEILWVPNFGISDKIRVKGKPTHRLKISKG